VHFISIDLGTTNVKVCVFDKNLDIIATGSKAVEYISDNERIEFSALRYFDDLIDLIRGCLAKTGKTEISRIVLTGQAESLVALDNDGAPLMNAISWMDARSARQCEEIKKIFDHETCYKTTGNPEMITTWPITKILWLKQQLPEVFQRVSKYVMLKDYIIYRLTGVLSGEYSIYNFTHYFDITSKEYWNDILEYVGISRAQLPELIEPCTDVGPVLPEIARELDVTGELLVNAGTLDHFASMIGTGNIRSGQISETTGTVMTLATLIEKPIFSSPPVGCHVGPFSDHYVMLAVCEGGGINLEWYKNQFLPGIDYNELNSILADRKIHPKLLYLPYISGVSAPDYDAGARGVFSGLEAHMDKYDMALAIMEGVAHQVERNIRYFNNLGIQSDSITSTGGGARSEIWNQLKADISNIRIAVPENEEAACLGAAMIGAVKAGVFSGYDDAVSLCVKIKKTFKPLNHDEMAKKHELFDLLYEQMKKVFIGG